MNLRRVTKILLLSTVAAWIGWDLVVWGDAPGDTISEVILGATHRYPVIAFAVGVVAGHLFWPQREER